MEEWIRRRTEDALGSRVRREILTVLDQGELSICALRAELSGEPSFSQVVHHLALLQDAELMRADGGRYRRAAP